MFYLTIAYSLIAVVLAGYGASLYRRLRGAERAIRALEQEQE